MKSLDPFTPDEIMAVCISRQIQDGEIVTQGLATPLITTGYLLARQTHAPHLYFASAIGQTICREPAPLSLLNIESLWLDKAMVGGSFIRGIADVLPNLKPREFFRPAQVDPHGNFNNIAFGEDYQKPRLRLPGTGGIPDVTTYFDHCCLYVPRHSRVTFVEKVDYVSGLGHHTARTQGAGPNYLISDLGQFDFATPEGENQCLPRMRLTSFHPGVKIKHIQSKTGFQLLISPEVVETTPPTEEELYLLRHEIDPLGIRRLELLSGAERRILLRKIIACESAQ